MALRDDLDFVSHGLLSDEDWPQPASGDPVKTAVLNALAALLATVAGLGSVQLETEFPFDLEDIPEAQRPALYIWDDDDDPLPGAHRLARNNLSVLLALFLPLPEGGFPAFALAAETLAARIYAKFMAPTGLKAAGVISITPGPKRKAKASETWGEMIIPCRIVYGHAVGDAFTTNLT